MNSIFVALGAAFLAGAAPATAQQEQAAGAAAQQPTKGEPGTTAGRPSSEGGVQVDVAPLIRSLIKHAVRPRPAPPVQAAGAVPETPAAPAAVTNPPAAPAAVTNPPAPSPTVAAPAIVAASQPSVSPPPPVPRPAASVAPKPLRHAVPAVHPRPVVATADPARPLLPAAAAPQPTPSPPPAVAPTAVVAPVAPIVPAAVDPPPPPPDRKWLFAAILGLLAVAIAAAGLAIRHHRVVRRTRSLLRIEPRLDLGRGRCSVAGLAFADAGNG